MNARAWLHSLFAAILAAAGSGITLILVDPAKFNPLTGGDWQSLFAAMGVQVLIAVGLFLKQSPLWDMPAPQDPPAA